MKNLGILIVIITLAFSCQKNSIEKESYYYPSKSYFKNLKTNSIKYSLDTFQTFIQLTDTINKYSCEDTELILTFNDSVNKYTFSLQNYCYNAIVCFEDYNLFYITNNLFFDSKFNNHPLDSINNVIDSFYLDNSERIHLKNAISIELDSNTSIKNVKSKFSTIFNAFNKLNAKNNESLELNLRLTVEEIFIIEEILDAPIPPKIKK